MRNITFESKLEQCVVISKPNLCKKYGVRSRLRSKGITLMIILILLVGYSIAVASSVDIEPAPPSDFSYVSNGSEIQINKYSGKGGIVRIPDEIDGVPVTRIASNTFERNKTITGVIFPANLKYIGENAFILCSNLTGVLYFPPTMETIGRAAFEFDNITGLIITSNCKIDFQTFAFCQELKFIYITEGSSPEIGYYSFQEDKKLETAIIPKTVNSFHDKSFESSNVVTIYTPANSTAHKFANEHFLGCNSDQYEALQREYGREYAAIMGNSINVGSPVNVSTSENKTGIENTKNADVSRMNELFTYSIKGNGSVSIKEFDWSKNSGDIYIPTMLDGYPVTSIEDEAFADGKKVSKENCMVVIPDSITIIGEKAFFNSPVSAVSIPASIKSIGKAAFAYCDITQFIVDQNQPNYATIEGVLYDKRNKSLLAYPQKKRIFSKIPEGIQSIGEYAFSGMTIGSNSSSGLCFTDILPSTLTRIEPYAFENCTLYYSTSDIGSGITYYNLEDNELALLPSKVTLVGAHAFAGCNFKCCSYSNPQKIVIGENLEEIEDYAFSDCKFYDDYDYDLYISKKSLDRIGEAAFASSIMLSDGNGKLKVRIHLSEEVNEIGDNAFFETHPVCIEEGVEIRILGNAAFRNTIVYTNTKKEKYQDEVPISLSIPGKMRTIPSQAFAYRFEDELNTVESIELQEGIKKIEKSAFAGRKALLTVSLPMTLTEIGEDAFSGCMKMEKINIPESVVKIGNNAFERQYITLIVTEGSYAEIWASENGYNYRYNETTESFDWLNSDIH